MNTSAPAHPAVRDELRAICRSAYLDSAPRLQKLLSYLVEESLAGNPLKESIVGVAVFGRDPGYDPKQDSVVRTEVRRLRAKLIAYYAAEGSARSVVIDLPKGSYVPAFRFREGAAAAPPTPAPRRIPGVSIRVLVSTVALLGAAVLLAYGLRKPVEPNAIVRRSVAVLDFRNLTTRPESNWLSGAIPEMISADLAGGPGLRTIPGENVSRMQTELALRPAASPARETLFAIRRNLGADIVVSGAYADLGAGQGSRLRVDIWALDAQTGEVISSISESGSQSEVLDVMSRAGARLRSGLHLETTPAVETAMREAAPRDPAAARAYADGLAHMRRADLLQARDLLRHAVEIEPAFAPAHAALASALAKLGYEGMARDEARRAFDLSRAISSEDIRLEIEAQFREVNHQPSQSVAAWRRLFARHPDDTEYGLNLAAAENNAAKPQDALRTIASLRKLPPSEAVDPRIDMEAAEAYSDRRGSADLAAEAARKALAAGARLLYARALSLESWQLWNLGEPSWRDLSEEALSICRELQDRDCESSILRHFGHASMAALDLEKADGYYAQALDAARQIGSIVEEGSALNGIALAAEGRGDLKRAAEIEDHLAALSRQRQSPGGEQAALDNMGDALLEMGEIEQAKEKIETATRLAREIGDPQSLADDLLSRADIYRVQGDLPNARRLCEEALGLARQAGAVNSLIAGFARKARILLLQDDLGGAQAALREYDRWRSKGVSMSAWEDRLLAPMVALAAAKPAQAAALAEEVARQAAGQKQPWQQARAEAILAEAELEQGQTAKAGQTASLAWSHIRNSQALLARLEVGIACARVTGRAGQLPGMISEAHAHGAYALELEGRLAATALAHDTVTSPAKPR